MNKTEKWHDYYQVNKSTRNHNISFQTTDGFASEDFTIPEDETFTRN